MSRGIPKLVQMQLVYSRAYSQCCNALKPIDAYYKPDVISLCNSRLAR